MTQIEISAVERHAIEVGDILLSANDVDLSRPEQLVEQVQKSDGLLKLMVRDVRGGRDVPVEVKWDSAMPDRGQGQSLGVTTQVAFIDGKAALKVVTVADGSPAQQAGIEPGLIILTADGSPLPKPENLAFAERQAKGILVLVVVEPRTRVERTVRADLR